MNPQLLKQLYADEGKVRYVYLDSLGIQSLGVGFNVDKDHGGGLDDEEMLWILVHRLQKAEDLLVHSFPGYNTLDPVRADALLNMAYNMGVPRLMGFIKFLGYIKQHDWVNASKEMLDSKWAGQVGLRANRLSKQIETGVYQ